MTTGIRQGARLMGMAVALTLGLAGAPAWAGQVTLQTMLDRFIADNDLPGGVLLVSGPKGRAVVASGTADKRSRAPVTPETRFYVASTGKMAVAAAVMQMVAEGKVRLDGRLGELLPNYPDLGRLANAKLATVEMLLGHTSGIPDYLDAFDAVINADPKRRWPAGEALKHGFNEPATGRPGKQYEYSNSNFLLLGMLLEKTDGRDLAAVLKSRVLDRAAMTHTTIGAEEKETGLAHGYSTDEDDRAKDASLIAWNTPYGDGPLVTTAEDLERFLFALFRDNGLVSPAMLARMIKPGKHDEEYGLGVELYDTDNGQEIGHTGSVDGFGAEAFYFSDERTAIVFMTNGDQTADGSLVDKVAKKLFRGDLALSGDAEQPAPAGSKRRRN